MDIRDKRQKLGKRIRALREANGFDGKRFALMIRMDRKYLAGIEEGTCSVGFDKLASIAEGLDMTLSELLEGVDSNDEEKAGK